MGMILVSEINIFQIGNYLTAQYRRLSYYPIMKYQIS